MADVHAGSREQRKRALLRDGEYYRAGVVQARAQVTHAAQPEVMFHSVIDHASWALRARADTLLHPTGTSVTALAPYILPAISFIRRRNLGKPALGVAALLGVAGWYVKRKRAELAAR
jgi:hypothetical protein